MTNIEFNEKYNDYILNGFHGLEFDIPEITEYLDKEFSKYINRGVEFYFSQIKIKFGGIRIYHSLDKIAIDEWEPKCNELYFKWKKINKK